MLYEEVAIAETPQHTDARQSGIGGSLNIDITVAHIDSILLIYAQFAQGGKDGIG